MTMFAAQAVLENQRVALQAQYNQAQVLFSKSRISSYPHGTGMHSSTVM
jgi:hypothetical protein